MAMADGASRSDIAEENKGDGRDAHRVSTRRLGVGLGVVGLADSMRNVVGSRRKKASIRRSRGFPG